MLLRQAWWRGPGSTWPWPRTTPQRRRGGRRRCRIRSGVRPARRRSTSRTNASTRRWESRDRNAANRAVATALDVAVTHGMLRTVATEGAPLMDLIEMASWRVPDTWMDRVRRAMFGVWAARDAERPVDDLTDRECDVLRLLPSRLTLTEIASELYVSQNTVKFHVRAIYRKLGAVSRAEAVESARCMRLLP